MNQRPKPFDDEFIHPKPTDTENSPRLVYNIQQVHGLTKKKVYGAKPARMPFFREERVRRESTGTIEPSSLVTPRERALSRTRAERAMRVAQSGSPTGTNRRDSRVSSPEPEGRTSPSSYHMSPPVSPTSMSTMYPQTEPIPIQQTASTDSPSWLQYPPTPAPLLTESAVSFSGYVNATQQPLVSIAVEIKADYSVLAATAVQQQGQPNTGAPSQLPIVAVPPRPPPFGPFGSSGEPATIPSRPPSSRRIILPEDEERFTFDEGYMAATAALFKKEVLPAYPNFCPQLDDNHHPASLEHSQQLSAAPRQSQPFYIMQDGGSVPPSPTALMHDDAYTPPSYQEDLRLLYHSLSLDYPMSAMAVDSPGFGYANSYSSGSSSSLTGWAG